MWHWPWTRLSVKPAAAFIALVCCLPLSETRAADPQPQAGIPATSVGPTSPEEATLLWKDGKADFQAGRMEDAMPKLERFIARYPGYPGYLEARLLLARAYLQTGKANEAKPLLRDYIQARGRALDAVLARMDLARAQLRLSQYPEALLTSDEILNLARKDQPEINAEALILKAKALMGLKRDARAQASLRSARKCMPEKAAPSLKGEALVTELGLKLRGCSKFPSAGRLDEAQVRDQLDRRGNCLQESLLVFRDILILGHPSPAREAQESIAGAYQSYWHACTHPPAPPRTRPRDRTPRQLEAYFRELGLVLKQDCRNKTKQGHELLKSWAPSVPATTSDSLNQAAAELEKRERHPE